MKLGDAFIIPPGVMRASSLIVGVLVVALSYGGPTTGVAMANGRVAPESVAGGGNNSVDYSRLAERRASRANK